MTKQEFIEHLRARLLEASSLAVSPEEFSKLFAQGVEYLSLSDENIAEIFSASRETANQWRSGKAAPALGMRWLVLEKLIALLRLM